MAVSSALFEPKRVDELADRIPLVTDYCIITPVGGPSGRATLAQMAVVGIGVGNPGQALVTSQDGLGHEWKSARDLMAVPVWNAAGTYLPATVVVHADGLWVAKTATQTGEEPAIGSTAWDQVGALQSEGIAQYKAGLQYKAGQHVWHQDELWKAKADTALEPAAANSAEWELMLPHWKESNAENLKAAAGGGIVIGISDTPPGTPRHGDQWIVGGGTATGDWVGQDGKLAIYDSQQAKWIFEDPAPGAFRFLAGDQAWAQYGNSGWLTVHPKGYDQTNTNAGWVRDGDGHPEGIAGARGTTPGKISATLEFTREDPTQANDPEDCISIHDCKKMVFSKPTAIKNVADPVDDIDAVNKHYVDQKVASIVGGISHGVAVDAISNTPPTTPGEGHEFIIGTQPTGAWVGHANKIAIWHNGAWVYTSPDQGDTHLVEGERANYSWNGTAWVKISELNPALNDVLPVGSVLMWCTGTIPSNYLELNGTDFSQAAYPDLYKVLGKTTLPDLRGKFVRGAGPGRAAQSSEDWKTGKPHRGLDQVFAREIGGHTHGITGPSQLAPHGGSNRVAWEGTQVGKWQSQEAGGHWHHIDFRSDWDSETCPNNVALVYIIKAKYAG